MTGTTQVGADLNEFCFEHTALFALQGCRLTRCGYTGEDGFELSVPLGQAVDLAQSLLKRPGVLPTGLGARDALRLEVCIVTNGTVEHYDYDRLPA